MKPQPDAYTVYLLMRGWAALGQNMWLTVLLLYHATMITSDPLKLVLIGVVVEGTTFLFEIPTGLVADTYGRRFSVILAFVITSVAMIIEGLFQVYALVLFAQFLSGLGFTFYSGAADAWIADEIGIEPSRAAYLRGTQISQVTALLGIGLATLLGSLQLNLPIVVAGLSMLGLAGLLFLFMQETGFTPAPRQERSVAREMVGTFRSSIDLVRTQRVFFSVLAVGVVTGLSVGGYDRLFTPYLLESFTFPFFQPVVWFGFLSAVTMLVTIAVVEGMRRRLRTSDHPRTVETLFWVYGGTIVGNLVFVLAPNLWVAMIAFWFSQSFRNASRPLLLMWINQHATTQVRATVISMYWQSNALGQILGAPLIGALGSLATLRAALLAASLALSPALTVFRRRFQQEKVGV